MAQMFSKQNENFFRFSSLLLDIGTEVLVQVLKSYYHPKLLKDYLAEPHISNKLANLLRKNVISQYQYDLLYPASTAPTVASFDITLLSCLLRNLHPSKRPGDNVWSSPASTDVSVEADVSRIRETRNILFGHMQSSAMSDMSFATESARLSSILQRLVANTPTSTLSVQDLNDKINHVLRDPLDSRRHNALMERLQHWYNMDIPQQLGDMRDDINRIEGKLDQMSLVKEFESESLICVDERKMHQRIRLTRDKIHNFIFHTKSVYLKTSVYQPASMQLQTNGLMIVVGLPGDGKTSLALSLLHDICSDDPNSYRPIQIDSPNEILELVDPRQRACLFLDDFLGKLATDDTVVRELNNVAASILTAVYTGNVLVLGTCRLSVYEKIKTSLSCTTTNEQLKVLFAEKYLFNMQESRNKISEGEKRDMLLRYCQLYAIKVDEAEIKKICGVTQVIGYPQCCKLLACLRENESIASIFETPSKYLYDETEELRRGHLPMYGMLVLILFCGGELSLESLKRESSKLDTVKDIFGLGTFSIEDIRQTIERCCPMYLEKDADNCYRFNHDIVHEAIFKSVGQHFLPETLQNCSISMLSKFCHGEEKNSSLIELSLYVPQMHFELVKRRFLDAVHTQAPELFQAISMAKLWECEQFLDEVCKEHAEEQQLKLLEDKNGHSLLVHSAKAGKIYLAQILLKLIDKSNCSNLFLENQLDLALQTACTYQNIEIISLLLRYITYISDEAMVEATKSGNVNILDSLVQKGGNLECKRAEYLGSTLLHFACLQSKYETMIYILQKCPSLLNVPDEGNRSVLYLACCGGNIDIVKHLLNLGMDIKCKGQRHQNVLHVCCLQGHSKLIEYLVEHYPHLLQETDGNNGTVLSYAATGGDVNLFKYLIGLGLNPECKDSFGRNVLADACYYGKETMVKHILQSYPAMVNQVEDNGATALHAAAYGGCNDVLDHLLEQGLNPHLKTKDGDTLTSYSCCKGEYNMTKSLLKRYPEMLHSRRNGGENLLHMTAISGNIELLKHLIQQGLDPLSTTNLGSTLTSFSCRNGEYNMTKYLLKRYPGVLHSRCNDGENLLHQTAISGNIELLKYLIQQGLDPLSTTNLGSTIRHIASQNGHLPMVKFISETYPELKQIKTNAGYLSLHLAATKGRMNIVQYLIDNGADPVCRSLTGATALHYACQYGHLYVVKYFVEHFPQMLQLGGQLTWTPIHYAANCGQIKVFEYLTNFVDPAIKSARGQENVLHVACAGGQVEMVDYLMKKYPDFMEQQSRFGSPLYHARAHGHTNVIEHLAEKWNIRK